MGGTTRGALWIVGGMALVAAGDNCTPLVIEHMGLTAAACQAIGYQSGESGAVALFDLSFLFWAPSLAWAFWGDTITPRMAAGMALIVIAGALAVWSGRRGNQPGRVTG